MGYTHQFRTNESLEEQQFKAIQDDFLKLLSSLNDNIKIIPEESIGWSTFFNHDDNKRPQPNEMAICFNGEPPNDHETFLLQNTLSGEYPTYCKTNEKPYDSLVVATLLIAKYRYPNWIQFQSDGNINELDFQLALNLIAKTFGLIFHLAYETPEDRNIVIQRVTENKHVQLKAKPITITTKSPLTGSFS